MFKFICKTRKTMVALALSICTFSFLNAYAMNEAEEEFEQAWNNPDYTQARLDDANINDILSKYYETPIPIHFTRQLLWDVEIRKAWDPKTYLSYVVRDGKSWDRKVLENGDEVFVRSTEQKQWLNSDVYAEVFEKVYLNYKDQKVTFIGSQRLKNSEGEDIYLQNDQPLFHVQHSVEGEENTPLNVWRIVYLTEQKDQRFIDRLQQLNDPTRLPGYVEIYIKKDLQIPLSHK
ncbi:hypothetical protein [Candidatus Protochlamydia phocaeensis]|uniref:hypothetical protein n=1 Tax=Candidatus Protochlamydia phocaeensis TaxID=1414722 RepID=UPI0008380D05|nr:hypothetical protein [Candidatus Protochlamydia phocaeensis]